jgi:hypothetical protein
MSPEFQAYLNKSTPEGVLMKQNIAIQLIEPFVSSKLSFAGIALGWATPEYAPEVLLEWMDSLSALTLSDGSTPLSHEMLTFNQADGLIAIAGFYPVADLPSSEAGDEYRKVSILINKETTDRSFDFAYSQVLGGALESDRIGVICVVVAEGSAVAESRIQEALALLTRDDSAEL